jgi:peptide-methionine (R)-S-oxide reductase
MIMTSYRTILLAALPPLVVSLSIPSPSYYHGSHRSRRIRRHRGVVVGGAMTMTTTTSTSLPLCIEPDDDDGLDNDDSSVEAEECCRGEGGKGHVRIMAETINRRDVLRHSASSLAAVVASAVATGGLVARPSPAHAGTNAKSRTAGYAIQHTEREWSESLSSMQYFVLREGGTEMPYSSILENEGRDGLYVCAGCETPLFESHAKFHSGTGWPSFADMIDDNVEVEDVPKFQYQLSGAEVRCRSCGGHLGDVFADGYLFVGTPAFVTGKRYCIDGAALAFVPSKRLGGGDIDDAASYEIVVGDRPPRSGGGRRFPG